MFETLKIHKGVQPTVYQELLIGIADISLTPPSHSLGCRYIPRLSLTAVGNSVDTEIVYGQGVDAEYFADMGGYDE